MKLCHETPCPAIAVSGRQSLDAVASRPCVRTCVHAQRSIHMQTPKCMHYRTQVHAYALAYVLEYLHSWPAYIHMSVRQRSRTYVLVVTTLTLEIYTLWSIVVRPWPLFGDPESLFPFTFKGKACSHLTQLTALPL